jgi:hypothetical protein
MSLRQRRRTPVASAAVRPFDDRRFSASIGAHRHCLLSWEACCAPCSRLGVARSARAHALAGPADGAPLMRAPLQAVAPVDLKRYAGMWHEQARLPNRFQKQCTGPVTADYMPLADGTIAGVEPLHPGRRHFRGSHRHGARGARRGPARCGSPPGALRALVAQLVADGHGATTGSSSWTANTRSRWSARRTASTCGCCRVPRVLDEAATLDRPSWTMPRSLGFDVDKVVRSLD